MARTSMNGNTLKFVKVAALHVLTDKSHPRYDARIELPLDPSFVESIRTEGVLVPIAVRPNGEIVAGKQRWRAAKECGIDFIPVIEFTGEMADLTLFLRRCAENNLRRGDDPATRIADARRLFGLGATVTQVAVTFGVEESTARSYVNVIENATPELAQLVQENALSVPAASTIADQTPEVQAEVIREVRESQVRALSAPDGKDKGITGSRKGDTRIETNPETGEPTPVTSVAAVLETVAKVKGRTRPATERKQAATVTVKAAPSPIRSEAAISQRIALLSRLAGLHPEAKDALEAAVLALKWAKGEAVVAPEGSTYAAAFARGFVETEATPVAAAAA